MTDITAITKEERAQGALRALLDYHQADEEGIMVNTSRQAIHEVERYVKELQAALTAVEKERDELRAHFRRLKAMMPLFQEARDALCAITETQRRLHGISSSLAHRMDQVGEPEKWEEFDRSARAALKGRE